ncbi:MAG: Ig-like domain-containing protein [Lachnospiraceae bacterium]|nr:Ig-like domain-containing protein [Lachnospiraceae bacterium]
MKEEFNLIDLDNTNTIPQVDVPEVTVEKKLPVANEVLEDEFVEAVTADLSDAVLFLQEENVEEKNTLSEEVQAQFDETTEAVVTEEASVKTESETFAESQPGSLEENETVQVTDAEERPEAANASAAVLSTETSELTLISDEELENMQPLEAREAKAAKDSIVEEPRDPALLPPGSITASMINLDEYPDKADVGKLIQKKQKELHAQQKTTILDKFRKIEPWHILAFALAFLIVSLAFLAVSKVAHDKKIKQQREEFVALGEQILALDRPGMQGVLAMEEAAEQIALAKEESEEQETVVVIPEEVDNTELRVVFISVEQDLKIKFTSVSTGRLMKDTQFSVTIKGPSGTFTLTDDDGDGIIYKKGLAAGSYTVSIASIGDHVFLDVPEFVDVKDKAQYVQIDVAQEIKTESEINVAVEDTAINQVVEEEPVSTDTVEWVESTQTTDESSAYVKIEKNEITEPFYAFLQEKVIVATDGDDTPGDGEEPGDSDEPGGEEPKEDITEKNVKELSLEKSEGELKEGESVSIVPTATLQNGTKITDAAKFTFKSSDASIASVDGSGKVKAEKAGTAEIKVSYRDENGNEKTVSYKVTVVKDPAQDKESRLKDKQGRMVYVKDGENYREAVYADYYTSSAFYIKDSAKVKYTGWQNINGNTYYYTKDGVPVTGDQIIGGITYHFNSEGILAMENNGIIGIDVSKWNGTIDWNKVAASGVKFAIIRCGYRGSTGGSLIADPTFVTNIQGAKAAGIKVGLYFFTQAVTELEAIEEASMAIALANTYGISYPIFIDTEQSGGRADRLDKATRTAVCKAFCETVKSAGYTPGVYASKFWFYDNVDYSQLSGYRIWVAQYASKTDFTGRFDMWQYTANGTCPGISGKVDYNISYLGY